MGPIRWIYNGDRVTDFLQYILNHETSAIFLVVCSTRDDFLAQLSAAIHTDSENTPERHYLLSNTIGLLAKSERIQVVFCPTLEHLRAHVSTLHLTRGVEKEIDGHEQRPLLALLNSIAVHAPTLEFAAQGLSRTLAAAVEVSFIEEMDLVLCECRDSTESTESLRGGTIWHVGVPLLNNTIRTGDEDAPGTERTVPVKRIIQRWFEFDPEPAAMDL